MIFLRSILLELDLLLLSIDKPDFLLSLCEDPEFEAYLNKDGYDHRDCHEHDDSRKIAQLLEIGI